MCETKEPLKLASKHCLSELYHPTTAHLVIDCLETAASYVCQLVDGAELPHGVYTTNLGLQCLIIYYSR